MRRTHFLRPRPQSQAAWTPRGHSCCQGGAAADDLGLPVDRLDANPGLARMPAAPQTRRTRGDRYVINVWGVGYRLVDAPMPRRRPPTSYG